ncbi:MAG TPA: glycerophosphodiester phosphodiesterase family protein [Verrucomicrobiae bacterium]|nr:glycerophosphodiester phosphodiesterase family protein [Verrucomicrobiae bacterium]
MSNAEKLLALKRPLVIGHRGYSHLAPENTLPSFKLAKAAGADLVELDYYHTKDDQMIVIHDGTLDRTTDATNRWGGSKIRVGSKTLAELQTLDAGSWFHPPYPNTHLPTLVESLDEIQSGGGVTLVERKEGDAASCVALLKEKGLVNALIVQAFEWSYLSNFHALCPEQVLGALGPPKIKGRTLTDAEKKMSPAWIDEAKKCGARIVVWNKEVTKETVAYAHKKGLEVWVYTIDDPAVATELLKLGVDGIITNNIAIIWRAVALHSSGKK